MTWPQRVFVSQVHHLSLSPMSQPLSRVLVLVCQWWMVRSPSRCAVDCHHIPHITIRGNYMGLITWRTALQNSLNIPALKLNARSATRKRCNGPKMGITEYQGTPNLTLVLGSLGIHLIDETSAYGSFGNTASMSKNTRLTRSRIPMVVSSISSMSRQ